MKANIYLHIGMHKTGTSSIQTTFYNNHDVLRAHGINYPRLSTGNPNHSVTLLPLFRRMPHRYRENRRTGFDTEEKAAKKNEKSLAALRQALKTNNSKSIVFSGEGLVALPASRLAQLKAELEPYAASFRVIVYVRDPYSTANSMIQQRVRRGQTYPQILPKPPHPRYSRIAAAIEVFGRENVDIRIFDRAQFVGGDLIVDFLSAIGAAPEIAKELHEARTNEAISHEAAYLMHEINKRFPSKDRDSPNVLAKPHLLKWLAEIPGQSYRCPRELLEAVQASVAREIAWLHGVLGKEIFSDKPPVLPSPKPYWQEGTLAAVALKFNELAERETWREWAQRPFTEIRRLTRRWRC